MLLLALQSAHNQVCLFGHLLVYVLALLVVFVYVFRLVESHGEILFHEQVHALPSVLHTSGSVDPRSDFEHDVAHRQRASVQSADVDDGFQSDVRVLVQLFQSVVGKNPVLSRHRHDVGSDAHGTEVEQRYQS